MPRPMFQIGESLREARTRRGLSPADVHKAIRIRERYLSALEEERWDMLPGDAYTRGFLRTYAEFLGLDGNLYADEYNARIAHREDEPHLVPVPAAVSRRRIRGGRLPAIAALLLVCGAVAGLAAWRLGGSSGPPTRSATTRQAGTTVAAPVAPVPTQKPKPAPAYALISATRGRCWLLVRAGGPNGGVLFEGVLESGQAKRFPLRPRVWVRLGAPAAVDLRVAGRLVPGLPGTPRNFVLSRSGAKPA